MTTPTIDRPSTSTGRDASALTSAPAMPPDELLYEARLQITGLTEYGVTLAELTARTAPIPPEGVRLDVAFEGTVSGPLLNGTGSVGANGLVEIRETIRLHSSHPRYRWVNTLGSWGASTVDFAKREINARSFVAHRAGP